MRFPVSASVSVSLLLILLISKSSYGFTNIYGDNQGFTLIVSTNQIANQYISVFSKEFITYSQNLNKKEQSSSTPSKVLKIVKEIKTGKDSSFVLLGSIVTWGSKKHGGDSSSVLDQLTDIQVIYSLACSFITIKKDTSIIGWGDSNWTKELLSEKARELNPYDQSFTPGHITLRSDH